jgi:hypothetical protein
MKMRPLAFAVLATCALVVPFACVKPQPEVSSATSEPRLPPVVSIGGVASTDDALAAPTSAPNTTASTASSNMPPNVALWNNYDPAVIKKCADSKCPPASAPGGSGFLMNQCNSLEKHLTGESQQRVIQCVVDRAAGGKNCETSVLYEKGGCLADWYAHTRATPEAKAACEPIVEKCGEYRSSALDPEVCAQMLASIAPSGRKHVNACIAGSCNRAGSRCAPTFIMNPNARPSSTWR